MRNPELAESELHIYCEGPRNEAERPLVAATRQIVHERARAGLLRIVERDQNMGCAASIVCGINEVLEKHDRIIVVEDDVVVSKHFLSYMNAALFKYQDDSRVMHISGYNFPLSDLESHNASFLPIISSWGWGTWRRAWQHFDADLSAWSWLKGSAWRRFRFDLYGAFNLWKMLEQYRCGEIDAWDIRWYLGVFRQSGLSLFPRSSLTANIGFDATATHQTDPRLTATVSQVSDAYVDQWPAVVKVDRRFLWEAMKFLANGRSWRARVSELVRSQLGLRVQQ